MTRGRPEGLTDRRSERQVFDRLVEAVRAGESRALVVRGDPGVGKTVLLDYLAGRAQGCRVARSVGVQTEMELAFAGLHQLCAPMLDRAEQLPVPQREALQTAFGLSAGPPPDRFLVGLAVLSLLSEAAGDRPLICLIDDQQWLDHASAQTLGFVARRLGADPVGLVFAAREPGAGAGRAARARSWGLAEGDARALLDSALAGPMDDRVRDRIVAETQGNPLALLELPRGLTPAELAGGFGLPGAAPLPGRIEESFRAAARGAAGRRPAAAAGWRRPNRPATCRWCGGPPSGWASRAGGRARGGGGPGGVRDAGAVPASAGALGVVPGGVDGGAAGRAQRTSRGDRRGGSIRTAGPGTGPRPRPGPTRRSRPSWSGPRAGRRPAAGWPRRRRSWSAQCC